MSRINKTRGFLYSLARVLGDINAIQHGPKAIAKRIVNRAIGRKVVRKMWWR